MNPPTGQVLQAMQKAMELFTPMLRSNCNPLDVMNSVNAVQTHYRKEMETMLAERNLLSSACEAALAALVESRDWIAKARADTGCVVHRELLDQLRAALRGQK